MVLSLPSFQHDFDYDDLSVSSTLTVDRLNNNKGLHATQEPFQKPKKQVHFDMGKNTHYTNQAFSSDDCKEHWYNTQDYREFKAIARDCAQQIMNIEARNRAPYSYQRVLEQMFDACLQAKNDNDEILSSSDFIHLQRWLEVASSRCGLEKWSIRKVSRDKSTRRREIAQTVLKVQYCMKTEADNANQQDSMDEFIRGTCENLSRPSRLYACTMAHALAAAIRKEYEEEQETILVSV